MRLPLIAAALLGLALPASAATEPDGAEVFTRTCATCHFARLDRARMGEMAAPPMDMLAAHVRDAVGDDRDAFVAWMVDWVKAPSEAKSIEPMAIRRFGLMPPIGDSFPGITDAELRAVAGWIHDEYRDVALPPPAERRRLQEKLGVQPH